MPPFINLTFNGDSVPFVARLLDLTGCPGRYLVDGEMHTLAFLRDNFTFLPS